MPVPWPHLLPCLLAAFCLLSNLALFLLLKAEIRRNLLRCRRERLALELVCGRLQSSVERLEDRIERLPARVIEIPLPPPPRPSLNRSHRAQVLRMARRGEQPAQIAAALGLPLQEVNLLLKLHQASLAALA